MCGIFGYLGFIEKDLAQACLKTLAHRGPDGHGLWSQSDVTLGHRRLSILDLSENAKQPMSYADGRYYITFNGEIYNFLEIRFELEQKGYHFQSQSDTEVILAAFIEWSEACLDKFNGMWSFAIWDCHEKALFLSRDRFGKKPLFYTVLPSGDFAFASEMKAFFPLLKDVRPNKKLVMDINCVFVYENTSECVIEEIKRFPAGYSGWVKQGKLTTKRWWNTLDNLVQVPLRYEEQVELFRELFLDASRLRMRSDVPLGTALSGGLDSSATISAMAHISGHGKTQRMGESWQHAFVASFPGTPLDETKYARMVTDNLGIDATVIEIDPLRAISDIDHYLYLFEDLYITSPIPFMLTYGAVKLHGTSVTLDGHGADELFAGYNFDYLIALKDAGFNLKQAYEIVGTYYDSLPQDSLQIAKMPSKSRFVAEFHAKGLAKKILRRGFQQVSRDVRHPAWEGLDYLNRQLYISTHETILPTLLRNYDRYSMANGVEIRMPFMDHRIVSFAFSIPWSSKVRDGYSKAIIRDAMAQFMPREVAYRKTKIGFNSPIVDWMKGPLKAYFLDTISCQSFKTSGLIDSQNVEKSIRYVIDNPDAKFSDGERAWTMLTPYLWERAVINGEGVAA
jgi:asparagine synthase (glutamine-hydrolysing)